MGLLRRIAGLAVVSVCRGGQRQTERPTHAIHRSGTLPDKPFAILDLRNALTRHGDRSIKLVEHRKPTVQRHAIILEYVEKSKMAEMCEGKH
jgi:hypothetical protein